MILIKTLVFIFAMPARICVSASRAPEGFVQAEASQTLLQYLVEKKVCNKFFYKTGLIVSKDCPHSIEDLATGLTCLCSARLLVGLTAQR